MLPLRDHNPSGRVPYVTYALIAINVVVFLSYFTLLTERRRREPWGSAGGQPGAPGRNSLNGEPLDGKCEGEVKPGDRLCIETPGGGGWGNP